MYVTPEIITAAGTVLATFVAVGSLLGWGIRRIDKRFEDVDKRFEVVDKRFEAIARDIRAVADDLKGVEHELSEVKIAVARLEGPTPRMIVAR